VQKDKRKVESGLLNKGFQTDDRDHHYFLYWTVDGKKSEVKTKTSHSKKTKSIADSLLGKMAQQCCLDKHQFIELIDCNFTRKQYEQILRDKGLI
jgi:hypothetical protein